MILTIRVAQVNDSERLRQCSLRVSPIDTRPIEHFVRILSRWPGLSCIAVDDEDEIVGGCLVRLKEDVQDATHGHVSALFVLSEYQGRGVGRRLLTTCVHSARTEFNVAVVTLHVRKSNEAAIALYTSLEFYTTQVKPGYYPDGEDALAMSLLVGNNMDA